jgi:hypothetical protein
LVRVIAIITLFTGLDRSITTAGRFTAITIIRRVIIAVVTAFAWTDHPVTTSSRLATVSAGIVIGVIAVITSLETRITLVNVAAHDTITASSQCTIVTTRIVIGRIAVVASLETQMPLG